MSRTGRTLVALVLTCLGLMIVLVAIYRTSESFRARVSYGSDLEQADLGGWRPLHRAAARGDVEMIDYLLDAGVDRNARTTRGETAWHIAETRDRVEAAEFLAQAGIDQSPGELPEISGPYLGQEMPGDAPELFMPGVVSGHYPAHSACVFSPSLTSVFWTVGMPPHGAVEMMEVEPGPGYTWSGPTLTEMTGEPSFSPDGKKLFFISRDPLEPGEAGGEENLWAKERTPEGWSAPEPLGEAVNSKRPHFHHSVDRFGNLYFSDYDTLYYSGFRDGEYGEAVGLAELTGNDTLKGNSPYVTPGADVLLFADKRGLRGKELFVSFKLDDGSWSERISLGPEVNAGRLNDSPRLTPAGNFLFFVSAGNGRPWGIYWVSASVLDELKATQLGMEEAPSRATAPRGSAPRIDGAFSEGEWSDAEVVELTATKKLFLKHDGVNLYVALDSVGGNLFFERGGRVDVVHASFALARAEYRQQESEWVLDSQSRDMSLHGLQNRPSVEIDAELGRHLEENGWTASLMPMGRPYETEWALALDWLGVEPGTDLSAVELPVLATRHDAGPPHLRPTWPANVSLPERWNAKDSSFDTDSWGMIVLRP